MTQYAIRQKIGTPNMHDRATGLHLRLPAPFQILQYHQHAWNGGSTDGRQYLHIERLSGDSDRIPTILADGDLDMYLAGIHAPEQVSPRTRGVEVAGTIGGQDVRGYLALTSYQAHRYLVFVAAPAEQHGSQQRSHALALAGLIAAAAV